MENNLNLEEALIPNPDLTTGGLLLSNILDLRIYEIGFILIYLFIFFFVIKNFIKVFEKYKNQVYFLISYHYIFIILAYIYSLLFVNDVDTFFQYGYLFGQDANDMQLANNFIIKINNLLIYFLNLHYFSIFIFIGFFSSIGLILLYVSFSELLDQYKLNSNIILIFFLFPSWHFFTSFPGKDAIFLFSIGMFYFALLKKNFLYLIISILLIYFVRQHIMFLIVVITLFVWLNHIIIRKFKNKIFYFFILILGSLIFLALLKLLSVNYYEHIIYFFEKGNLYRNYSNQYAGWYDTGNNFIINSFLYLFKPIFDFSSLQRIIISLENFLILITIFYTILNFEKKLFFPIIQKKEFVFSILFFLITVVVLSNFTANIGISSRQKWMMLPSLFLFLAPLFSKRKF